MHVRLGKYVLNPFLLRSHYEPPSGRALPGLLPSRVYIRVSSSMTLTDGIAVRYGSITGLVKSSD